MCVQEGCGRVCSRHCYSLRFFVWLVARSLSLRCKRCWNDTVPVFGRNEDEDDVFMSFNLSDSILSRRRCAALSCSNLVAAFTICCSGYAAASTRFRSSSTRWSRIIVSSVPNTTSGSRAITASVYKLIRSVIWDAWFFWICGRTFILFSYIER